MWKPIPAWPMLTFKRRQPSVSEATIQLAEGNTRDLEGNNRDSKSYGATPSVLPPDMANQQNPSPQVSSSPPKEIGPNPAQRRYFETIASLPMGLRLEIFPATSPAMNPLPQDLFPCTPQDQSNPTTVPHRPKPKRTPSNPTQPSRRRPAADAASTLCTARICAIILSRLVNPNSP